MSVRGVPGSEGEDGLRSGSQHCPANSVTQTVSAAKRRKSATPGRKPWMKEPDELSPEGAKET